VPILNPEYDPDWKGRFDRALAKANASRSSEDLAVMHRAFWAQFRTMREIRDFHFDSLRKKAEISGLEIILPEVGDDCTWEQIAEAYGRGDDAINERYMENYKKPYAQPEGLEAFGDDNEGIQRQVERFEYSGFWGSPSACIVTSEYQGKSAYICFTLILGAGTSPINMMEDLATMIYKDRLSDRYKPDQVHWFAYFHFRGFTGHEGFMEACMRWDRKQKQYKDPSWTHFASIPRAIAETADLAEPRPDLPRVISKTRESGEISPENSEAI
jgi:hypothetical protein